MFKKLVLLNDRFWDWLRSLGVRGGLYALGLALSPHAFFIAGNLVKSFDAAMTLYIVGTLYFAVIAGSAFVTECRYHWLPRAG